MAHDIERLSRLIGRLYDAPFDNSALPAALGELARLAGVEKASVIDSFPDGSRAISAAVGLEQGSIDAYNGHYHRLDALVPASGAPLVAFTRTNANTHWPDFARSEFFNDWARPGGNVQIAFVTVPLASGIRSSLLLVAPARDRGFGNAGQIMLLQLVAPHFQRAVAMTAQVAGLERQRDQFLAALGGSSHCVLVLDRDARVRHAAGKAVELMQAGDGLRLTSRGLRAEHPEADRKLAALIARALSCPDIGRPARLGPVSVPRGACAPPLLVEAVPLCAPRRPGEHWTCAGLDDGAILVIVVDPAQATRPPAELLRSAFGLTAAEAAVALLVLDGQGLKSVAEQLGVAISTVRTHLQRVFGKTDTNRQAELVRLLGALCAHGDASPAGKRADSGSRTVSPSERSGKTLQHNLIITIT